MLTQIQFVKIPTSEALTYYTEKKLKKLTSKFEMIKAIDVYFKLEKDPKGEGKICEIECSIPGTKVFAATSQNYFEHAVKVAIAEIEKQLEKRKAVMMVY
ncbi:HPF/RaiA family ribosome-associated protein [Gramella jeungdoensis]|uniref:HPF/RaiA family ribosome-associated protein n=1 Tax=Gramella jeungdoensis TaxID=708091 RepID=A0ABT0Z0Q1_9FLAO|nr:HPF/RaiA family ribosome-associated protein [Gramella jeungdoensis]MCM8569301.1 HPF/RaiA family ribosome-associated protein [Gramella jeungdoensis]